ncbi:flagellar basal body-associated FliL family protein [Rhizobiaceae bacterium]|nr:flagellar basal body-associated FliL family protein [Rhizobiaceae bacterium]
MSAARPDDTGKAKPSVIIVLGAVVVMIIVGVGAGFGASLIVAMNGPSATNELALEDQVSTASVEPVDDHLVTLEPLLTNLARPSDVWVRLEVALSSRQALPEGEAEAVGQDLLAYLRSMRLDEVEGPSGFLALREELDTRAATRSEGRVSHVLIRTLLFE